MNNQLMTFDFEKNAIHVELINGVPHFLAKDVCDALGLGNNRKAIMGLEEYQKLTLPVVTAGQGRNMNFVNESGLYSLIFQSRKAEAKAFQKWVTCEVLPEIRRTGGYGGGDPLARIPVFELLDGRKGYYYQDVLNKLEQNGSGLVHDRRKMYPNHFYKNEAGRVLISYELTQMLRDSKAAYGLRKQLKAMPPIMPIALTEKEVSHG